MFQHMPSFAIEDLEKEHAGPVQCMGIRSLPIDLRSPCRCQVALSLVEDRPALLIHLLPLSSVDEGGILTGRLRDCAANSNYILRIAEEAQYVGKKGERDNNIERLLLRTARTKRQTVDRPDSRRISVLPALSVFPAGRRRTSL